jgi:hypothetical protein
MLNTSNSDELCQPFFLTAVLKSAWAIEKGEKGVETDAENSW